jgi:hypothetical protein
MVTVLQRRSYSRRLFGVDEKFAGPHYRKLHGLADKSGYVGNRRRIWKLRYIAFG